MDYIKKTKKIVNSECHAAVLPKINEDWYLFENAEEDNINFKERQPMLIDGSMIQTFYISSH